MNVSQGSANPQRGRGVGGGCGSGVGGIRRENEFGNRGIIEPIGRGFNNGFGNNGFGNNGFGNNGFGNVGFGNNGFGNNGFGREPVVIERVLVPEIGRRRF